MNLNEGGTYMYSLDWIKNKKAAINSINKNQQLLLIFCVLKKKKYILLAFQIITQITSYCSKKTISSIKKNTIKI